MKYFIPHLSGYWFFICNAQDSILQRIIMIGDAGEIDQAQQAVIPAASNLILREKRPSYIWVIIFIHADGLAGQQGRRKNQKHSAIPI